ncbi:MAG TPA: SRPBCC family protein [Vicinamibacterales bacterium]|nr:SRPBCC family protein [Vicinamibacterales bacterium]
MPEIVVDVVVRAPADVVFQFATTPRNWPKFWPVTLGVTGSVDQSPHIGARWTEKVRLWFWTGDFFWHAVATSPPRSFEMHCTTKGFGLLGRLAGRTTGQIRYELREHEGRTTLKRVLHYQEARLLGRLLDVLITRWFLTMVARRALANLATIFDRAHEGGAA